MLIYKLISRINSLSYLKDRFLACLTEDDKCIMADIVPGDCGAVKALASFEVLDILLTCECKHCEECDYLCDKLMKIKVDVLEIVES